MKEKDFIFEKFFALHNSIAALERKKNLKQRKQILCWATSRYDSKTSYLSTLGLELTKDHSFWFANLEQLQCCKEKKL